MTKILQTLFLAGALAMSTMTFAEAQQVDNQKSCGGSALMNNHRSRCPNFKHHHHHHHMHWHHKHSM